MRAIIEAKHVDELRPDDVLWEKISKGLLRNPDQPLKNTDKRMVHIYNMFFVKKDFTFDFRTVKSGEIHLIQTTNVPMLIYEFPSSSLRCRANPNLFRRIFEPYDQMLYHRMVLEPHTAYQISAGTRYILLMVQKTVFETNKRSLEKPGPFSKRNRVFIAPIVRPSVAPVLISRPCTSLATPQPVSIPESPELTTPQILLPDPPRTPELPTPLVQIAHPAVKIPVFQPPVQIPPVPTTPPVQLFLPDPPPVQILLPPVVKTLEPTLTDNSSIDQIMSSVFGDC
ncbi:hypothetical protein TNCV_1835741 [Trichonephila clavipes]|nr:hypothetical protein TNCV_1835741 [Trichonephila clavipes]